MFILRCSTRANRLKQFAGLNEINPAAILQRSLGAIVTEYIFDNSYRSCSNILALFDLG